MFGLVAGLLWMLACSPDDCRAEVPLLPAIRLAGPINPVVADFISGEIAEANRIGAAAFLLEIDTPGGLDTAMREIIQAILASELPIIVYVYPAGARAASAGALITLAADFAVMAPGTNIGAATPVAIGPSGGNDDGPMKDKILNDAIAYARSIAEQRGRNLDWAERIVRHSVSTAAQEALELKVIDLVAADEADLIRQLEGRSYLRRGTVHHLALAGAELKFATMNWRQQILDTISNPTVAYLLLMLGILGIFFEISQPGVILPGVVGAIALLMALFALQTLPVNYAGVLLILLAVVLFVLEIKVTSFGMLTVGGIVSLALGSLMLIDSPEPYMQISKRVILVTVGSCAGFIIFCLYYVVRAQRRRFASGAEGMVGEHGRVVNAIAGVGRVFVHGEYWDAVADVEIPAGAEVEVVAMVEGLRLKVRPGGGSRATGGGSPDKPAAGE